MQGFLTSRQNGLAVRIGQMGIASTSKGVVMGMKDEGYGLLFGGLTSTLLPNKALPSDTVQEVRLRLAPLPLIGLAI